MNPIILILIILLVLIFFYIWNQSRLKKYRENLIKTYKFPKKIENEILKKYPHLNEHQVKSVLSGLRTYFYLCNDSNKRFISMPSQVVDVAWHEFILFTREYESFCNRALGRFLHHTPAEAMRKPTLAQDGIKRAWRLSCKREKIDPLNPNHLPTLFAIDALLNIEDGFKYSLDCSKSDSNQYCAGHIACGGGCAGGCGSSESCDSSCGGGCGGD